jgi:ribosomal protein S17
VLPYLTEVQNPSKKYSVVFRGINYGEGTQDGEFSETYNLSTDNYPAITQRAERIKAKDYNAPSTIHAKGSLLVIAERLDEEGKATGVSDVYYDDKVVGEIPSGKKQTATVGNYIVIFPDKKYYKVPTEDENGEMQEGIYGNMEEEYKVSGLTFTSSTISMDIKYAATHLVFENSTISKSGAEFPFKVGDVVTISGTSGIDSTKEYKVTEATTDSLTLEGASFGNRWTSAVEITISRKATDKFSFREGDAVTITGCKKSENNKKQEILIRGVNNGELTFDENAFTEATEYEEVVIKRSVPDLDFICESNYRLWGTHGNTIYSSKFSDPLNFKVFDNLASDSYAIDVGSEGDFTGCIPFSTHICFFKENTLHKLYGTKPSNFQITTVNVYGVQSGSERSMQIVNEQLLYKGVGGVYSYAGGIPELISGKFGNKRYSEAVACCDGEKYYISMKQGDTWSMYAYDVLKNIWLREDDTHAIDMTFYDGKVYYIDDKGGLYYIDKTADRSNIEWGATFCTMHETINERKGYSKFHLRMDMSAGAWLAVDIKTDNDTQWKQIYTTHNEKAKTVSIPIVPTRCDSIDIRLRGKGICTVKAFIREFSVGSDV